ncbi:MAG: hypothetical protein ACD_55C00136G0003 [uncultured bacterium]|uniref:histidine kinase n=1 Tax=Citrifermentans bemidjiense (strain ATCC BAA-1014 / DSM 16622 / JCM 12645 / Bem) TaxID=404380 RepID=B5EGR1_CITBB|nr:PAS domain S-box protein [Citrifermentans bemidjiense]ACH39544.1 sensor histidine kinase, CHASE, PAS and PAS domain-containing [Citrifermentans bemidjiense Bem]EKD59163.1 MAG: hypothetical protein ACD_55C00136G0003 [uncultured bacterium]
MDLTSGQHTDPEIPGRRGRTVYSSLRQSLTALLFLLVLAVIGCLVANRIYEGYLAGKERGSAAILLGTKGYALSAGITRRVALLEGLYAFTEANTSESDFGRRFDVYAAGLHAGAKDVRLFAITREGVIRYLYPVKGNERAMELDLFLAPLTREDALRTLNSRGTTLSNPYELRQGGLGVVARKAVFAKGEFWGFATLVIDIPSVLAEAGLDRQDRLDMTVRDRAGKVFYGDAGIFAKSPVMLHIGLPEGYWELAAVPKGGWEAPVRRDLLIFRLGTFFTASCLAFIVFQIYDRQRRLRNAVQERTAALKEIENYNRTLFELSPIGLALCSMDGVLVDVNTAYADILGRTVAETLGLSYWEITPEKYEDQERMRLERLETVGFYGPYEKEYCRRDGRLVPVRLHGRIIERNKARFIWSSVEDITDRKHAEAEIKREHAFSEALIDSLPGVVYLYDQEMNFLRWNKNFERVTGYAPEEILRLQPLDFFVEKDKALLQSRIQEVFVKGASNVEAGFVAKDGSSAPYFFTGLRTEIDGKTCLIGIGIDISDRKRLEEELTALNLNLETRVAERTQELNEKSAQLAAANEKLKEVDRLKSMFIASMSHELRTPLNSVIGYSSIILNEWLGPLQPTQKENLAIVLRAGKHLLSLINDVIDVSKIEAGQIEVHNEEFDLFDLVQEAAQQLEPEIRGKGLAFPVTNIHLQLLADRRRLLQAVLNLLSNAMKYTVEGSIQLAVNFDGTWAEISVADSGIGISEQDAKLVFQPFRRLDSSLRGTVSGTGLGLYLTNKLVREVLGGTITFVSAVGQGSTFTIRIPVTVGADAEAKERVS